MDNESPASRVERTFWTFWNYISGAVSRFLRPEPTNIGSNDPNSTQESAVDSEPAKSGHAEGEASRGGVDEEQSLARVSILSSSRPVVGWELCTTEIDLGPDEESMQHKTQVSCASESKPSEEGEGTREEQVARTGNDNAGLLVAKDDKQEENSNQKLGTHGLDDTSESDEHREHARSPSLTGEATSQYLEGSRKEAVDEDERDVNIEVKLCTFADMSLGQKDDLHLEKATVPRYKVDTAVMHEVVEDRDDVVLLASKIEQTPGEEERKVEIQISACEELSDGNGDNKGGPGVTALPAELQAASNDEPIVVGQGHVMAHRNESDEAEDAKVKENESTSDEREQGGIPAEEDVNEAANSQTVDEVAEQDNKGSVTRDSQDSHILTGRVTCSEGVVWNAETELHSVECTDGGQEDVAEDTQVPTEPKETDEDTTESHSKAIDGKSDVTTTDFSMEEKFIDKDQAEEDMVSSGVDDKESYMEVTWKTGQEESGGFKNTPLGMFEGRLVVSQELNRPTCEETQEGVPAYNNEPGPDENTTQRFLEVGDCEEIPATQLPEEVENEEPESLQNSGCSAGAGYLLVQEHMEEEQESRADIDLGVQDDAGVLRLADPRFPQETVEPVIQDSGPLCEEEEGKELHDSMKTGIERTEEEFETHAGLSDETNKTTKELQDGTEELLVDFETDEGLFDSNENEAAVGGHETTEGATAEEVADVQKMPEMSFFQESVDPIKSEQSSNNTHSLLEEFTESGFLKMVETEPQLLEDSTVGIQDAGVDMGETGYGAEGEAVENEVQTENEMEVNLQVGGMTAEITTECSEKENTLIGESESLETKNQLLDEALEMSNEDTDESMATETKPEDLTTISAEETAHVTESEGTVNPISGHQDVIDEEILDLWIQTALSEDTDDMKQEGPEPEQQMHADVEPSNVEQEEISSVQTEEDKEKPVESHLGESELVSDTEVSSSTAESGFLDQSLVEWDTQNNETHLLTSTTTGSFQGIYDMLANVPESTDISEMTTQQPDSEPQDVLMVETAENGQTYPEEVASVTETGLHPDSGIVSSDDKPLNQESDKSQEETEKETGSQKEIDAELTDQGRKTDEEDRGDADVKSLIEMSAPFKVEETQVEEEPLEITPDEIERSDSGRSRGGSEASLEEEIVSTESGSQDDTCSESESFQLPSLDKPQPSWSEDVNSLPGLNSAEVAQELTTEFEDQIEVDASVLDCTAQRSRIAVKNPRVRPPKDPRSLLHMPSLDPTPSSRLPVKVPAGVPLGGLGIGIKLPGLGAGFPVLKKTQRAVRDESSPDTVSQEHEANPEKSDAPKQDEAQHKPKWMPPKHPGFGNPLMSELKSKLKKTTKE